MSVPTLVCCVLDKSGSMHHLKHATIEGFNSFLQDQLRQPGECRMSLTQFDTTFQVDYVGEDIHYVKPLDIMSYQPNGGTALLDAVGTTIKGAEQWIINNNTVMPWYPAGQNPRNRGWKVLVAIFTDGEENSSSRWHIYNPMKEGDQYDLGGLIQWKQNEGWEFMFLGTGGSQWLERTFGQYVAHDHFVGYVSSPEAHRHTYAGLSSATSTLRSTGTFNTNVFDDGHKSTVEKQQP